MISDRWHVRGRWWSVVHEGWIVVSCQLMRGECVRCVVYEGWVGGVYMRGVVSWVVHGVHGWCISGSWWCQVSGV